MMRRDAVGNALYKMGPCRCEFVEAKRLWRSDSDRDRVTGKRLAMTSIVMSSQIHPLG